MQTDFKGVWLDRIDILNIHLKWFVYDLAIFTSLPFHFFQLKTWLCFLEKNTMFKV